MTVGGETTWGETTWGELIWGRNDLGRIDLYSNRIIRSWFGGSGISEKNRTGQHTQIFLH